MYQSCVNECTFSGLSLTLAVLYTKYYRTSKCSTRVLAVWMCWCMGFCHISITHVCTATHIPANQPKIAAWVYVCVCVLWGLWVILCKSCYVSVYTMLSVHHRVREITLEVENGGSPHSEGGNRPMTCTLC